jgi:hypothetical protein
LSARSRAGLAVLAATAGFGHVLYPLWLWAKTRTLPERHPPPAPESWPAVSVVVAAHREAGLIAAKVEDLVENGYAGPLEVIIVADDRATADAAGEAPAAKVLAFDRRLGKPEALNRGIAEATGDVVVITDANAKLAPGSLAALVRWFAHDGVAGVAGEKVVLGAGGEGIYWRFESWLKRQEARSGTTIGLVGELAAFERDRFRPLPRDLAVDDLWLALDLIEGGGNILYEPSARSEEPESPDLGADWRRRTRVVIGTLDVLWRRRSLLVPGSSPATPQLWGHRLVRSSAGPMAHAALLALALRQAPRNPAAATFAGAHAWGATLLLRRLRGQRLGRLEAAVAQVLYLQVVGAAGTVRFLRGERPVFWHKDAR